MAQETPVMKVRSYLRLIFPSAFTALSLTILPIVLTGYYAVTRMSDKLVNDQTLNFVDFQNNFLATIFFSQGWVEWFNQALDFILWGAVAAIVLVIIWAIGAARVAVDNHNAQTKFKHFNVGEGTWHGQFAVIAFIKLLLIGVALFCAVIILINGVPQLGLTVEQAVYEESFSSFKNAFTAGVSIFVMEYAIATSLRLFRHLRTDG